MNQLQVLPEEEYLPIFEYLNYEVSSLGNVKNIITGRILKQSFNNGHYRVHFFLSKEEKTTETVHRLVAYAFLLNRECKPSVIHIDKDSKNNNAKNLQYSTTSEINHIKGLQCNNKSGVKGVFQMKNDLKWYAQIGHNNKKFDLGKFNNFEDAVKARKKAELKYFGETKK